jgi:hypothetical protein
MTMAGRKPRKRLTMILGMPADQFLALECFYYRATGRAPDPEFVRRLMQFHEENHPARPLTSVEIAARVDYLAPRFPSLRATIQHVAKSERKTFDAVRAIHKRFGRYDRAALDEQRAALRRQWKDQPEDRLAAIGLRQTELRKPGPRKKAAKR